MAKKKVWAFPLVPLFLVCFLHSQSVTDLAKKEKERRAQLKGKTAAVVTNADLSKVKKRPAVEVAQVEKPAAEAEAGGENAAAAAQGAAPPATASAPPVQKIEEPAPPPDESVMSEKDFRARLEELSKKAQDAQEMIDLLTLKMNALWQEFYNLGDVKSREYTQFQISETYDKLTKAEAEAARAKKDLDDFMATAKREGVPPIWIK
jgi:hypothetical protein